MFVGEAPGRLGADNSGIPFHGDQAGHNFEKLIEHVGLDRYSIFVTNAVLCNPKDSDGNNTTPSRKEIANCSGHLRQQIDLIAPKIIVTLGGTALFALSLIEAHSLNLAQHVRTANPWCGRVLIPVYHPGQRAMIHRSYSNQLADYQFICEQLRRHGKKVRPVSTSLKTDVRIVVDVLMSYKPSMSYFCLHKLFYLVELSAIRRYGHRFTTAYIVRQKDGPYCTDLHLKKLQSAFPDITIRRSGSRLMVCRDHPDMFTRSSAMQTPLGDAIDDVVREVIVRYGNDNESALKRRVYLTAPMRAILRAERHRRLNLFNAPIDFGSA